MNKKIVLAMGTFLSALAMGCATEKGKSADGNSDVAVKWRLMTNFKNANDDTFEGRFRLINKGDKPLDGGNWAMFFSMSPRSISNNTSPQPAVVQHINGDWYKLVPEEGFKLAPGDSIDIQYLGTEALFKESDAPLGLYIVHYDEQGNETSIEQVNQYTIEPFDTREQKLRGRNDKYEEASVQKSFKDYERLGATLLPENEVQKIIPSPVSFQLGEGQLTIPSSIEISYQAGFEKEVEFLKSRLAELGVRSSVTVGDNPKALIQLKKAPVKVNGATKEAYKLSVGDQIVVEANDRGGAFYGIQSMFAMVPNMYWDKKTSPIKITKANIEDAPRFDFRSMHLDVTRNFQTKESVKRVIDLLAFYKINHLLFYITDDEGWRVEIDGLPELTEVSGQRGHVSSLAVNGLHPAYGSGPKPYDETKHGSGFYTKAEFVEILKYADQRNITVIPSVNFPGHARAAIKAMEARYERLMKAGDKEGAEMYRLADPDDKSEYLSPQFYRDNVVSVARESSYRFYEKVVDEFINMYQEAGLTLRKFNTGGDEVAEGAWAKSPLAMQLLKENPSLGNPKNMQVYFFRKLVPLLQKRNLEIHGWEDIALMKNAQGKYVPNPEFVKDKIVPYIWNNLYDLDLGYKLANAGYPVVLCNVTNFYLDFAYNNDPKEAGLYWGGFGSMRQSWEFAPYNFFRTTHTTAFGDSLDFSKVQHLKPEARKNIIGLEAQLWCEAVRGREMMEYAILPKIIGFAESAWAPARDWEEIENKEARNKAITASWNVFANRVGQVDLPRLRYLNGGYNYRVAPPGIKIENGQVLINTELPGFSVYYTTDGSEPTINSKIYSGPIKLSDGKIRARAFDKAGSASRTVELQIP